MISFELSTHIYRPLKQVFRFVAAPENDFQWQYGTLASTQISSGEMGMGSLFRVVGHFLGQRMDSVFEVTGFEPNKSYGFKSVSGPMISNTLYTFGMMGGRTEVNIATRIEPGDFFKATITIAGKGIKKQYRENLALLKSVLEASQVERMPQ